MLMLLFNGVNLNTGALKESFYQIKMKFIRIFFLILGKKAMINFLVWDTKRSSNINGKAGICILTCEKTHFSKDIDQMNLRTNAKFIRINGGFLEFFLKTFLPPDLQRQSFYQPTQDKQIYARHWDEARAFCEELLIKIQNAFNEKIERVLVSNIDYWQPEGLRLAAEKMSIPFYALVRENFLLLDQQITYKKYYQDLKFKFKGDGIAVFSDLTKQLYDSSDLFERSKIVVTGAPRFDFWRDAKVPEFKNRQAITLFSFAHPDYLAPKTFLRILELFVEAAIRNPQVQFIVKAKDRGDYYFISKRIKSFPPNLSVEYKMTVPEAIMRSKLVIGFNSLTVLEAIIARAAVGVPYFSDAVLKDDFLIYTPNNAKHSEVIRFYKDEQAALDHIEEALKATELKTWFSEEARLACISSMVYYPPLQTNSEVVYNFLRNTAGERNSP